MLTIMPHHNRVAVEAAAGFEDASPDHPADCHAGDVLPVLIAGPPTEQRTTLFSFALKLVLAWT